MAQLAVLAGKALTAIKGAGLAKSLQVGGTILSGVGSVAAAGAASSAAAFEARQIEAQGKAEQAAAQREALQERRGAQLAQSRARAVAAASGGGQDYDLLGDLEEEGELRFQTAIWAGNERAAGRNLQAEGARLDGRSRRNANLFKAGSTLLGGAAEYHKDYGIPLIEKYG